MEAEGNPLVRAQLIWIFLHMQELGLDGICPLLTLCLLLLWSLSCMGEMLLLLSNLQGGMVWELVSDV